MGYRSDCSVGKWGVTCLKNWCLLTCGLEIHGGGGGGYPPWPDPGGVYSLPNHGCPAGSVCTQYWPQIPQGSYFDEWMCIFNDSTPALGAK